MPLMRRSLTMGKGFPGNRMKKQVWDTIANAMVNFPRTRLKGVVLGFRYSNFELATNTTRRMRSRTMRRSSLRSQMKIKTLEYPREYKQEEEPDDEEELPEQSDEDEDLKAAHDSELDIDSSEDEVEGNNEEEPDEGEEVQEESDDEEVFQYPHQSVRDGDSLENDEGDLEGQGDGAIADADRTTDAYVGFSDTRPRRSARLNPGLSWA
ncbi:hypothetical protein B0H14DRAFT_1438169 [Mycena olivaceomarginata]|nr:hypothetical protein B0H14DRAFT_1438169 [Mycena olivaceomarginata]